jgi:hypothetical protein
MKLDELGLDRVKLFGLPYHGLWKAGSITLPNAATKTCAAPIGGGVVLLKVPDQPAVTRSTGELAGDVAAGREWRNYGLLSGGRYGPVQVPSFTGEAVVFLIDGAKRSWLMRVLTNPGMANHMTVRLRRFGLIDGTSHPDWSAPIDVALSSDVVGLPHSSYLGSTYALKCVCQNSTGREFVIGYVTNDSDGYSWAETLCKINVAGTVDLSAADFGLTFSHTVLQHQGDTNFTEAHVSTSSGICRHERTIDYEEYPVGGGAPTGNVFTRTIVWENGAIVSDSGTPTHGTGNWSEWANHRTDTRTSTMVYAETSVEESVFYVWAGYYNDLLKLVELRTTKTINGGAPASTLVADNVWTTGVFSKSAVKRIQIKYGSATLLDESWSDVSSASSGSVGYNASMSASSGASDFDRSEVNTTAQGHAHYKLILAEQRKLWLSSSTIKFATPFPEAWSSPVVRLASASHLSSSGGLIGFSSAPELIGAYAPSGTNQALSGGLDTKYASWHPVTDQLTVDSQPICWF